MGFLTSNRSSRPLERALPRIRAPSKMKVASGGQIPKANPPFLPNKKASATLSESEIEDIDFESQIKLAQSTSPCTCLWLSSDCDSSSISGDLSELNLQNQSFKDQGSFESSLSGWASPAHNLIAPLSKEKGGHNSQFMQNLCSSVCSVDGLDRTCSWISTMDLNFKSCEGVNYVHSYYSSSSNSYRENSRSKSSCPTENSSEFDNEEPLFLPYNEYILAEKISPCVSLIKKKEKMAGKEAKLKNSDLSAARKKGPQPHSERRPEKLETPKKSVIEFKNIPPTSKSVKNSLLSPSDMSSIKASVKPLVHDFLKKKRNNTRKCSLNSANSGNIDLAELPKKPLLEFESNFFLDVFMAGCTVEKIVGLTEFDGHEWLNLSSK